MGHLQLDTSTRAWLTSRRAALRTAAIRCDAASADWNRRNDELNDLAKRSRWDDLKTARVKAANDGLNDAYGAWNFWQQEVRRLAADIQAELTYRRALADADDDPTGLLYSRDDDEPARPVPAHVDGLSITGRPPRVRPTNSPAGSATDTVERRTSSFSGRSGSNQPAAYLGRTAAGPAGAGTPTPAPATPRGGAA